MLRLIASRHNIWYAKSVKNERLKMSDFPVPRSHIEAGLNAVGARYAAFEYDSLVLSSAEAFEAGNREASLVPYVRFMVDATIESLKHYVPPLGSEAQQTYREVTERVKVASRYARAIISFDTHPDYPDLVNPFFEDLYTTSPILRAITEKDETMPRAFVIDSSYMSSLISTTFSDVGAAS